MTDTAWSRRAVLSVGAASLTLAASGAAAEIITDIDSATLAKSKKTPLGLYLSPKAAHQALQENPEIKLDLGGFQVAAGLRLRF